MFRVYGLILINIILGMVLDLIIINIYNGRV